MPLTNPSPILHQNINTVMKMKPEEKEVSANTLMGPPKRRQMNDDKRGDPMQPSRRIASYIEAIRQKREEITNA
jgi:hypothetical protein